MYFISSFNVKQNNLTGKQDFVDIQPFRNTVGSQIFTQLGKAARSLGSCNPPCKQWKYKFFSEIQSKTPMMMMSRAKVQFGNPPSGQRMIPLASLLEFPNAHLTEGAGNRSRMSMGALMYALSRAHTPLPLIQTDNHVVYMKSSAVQPNPSFSLYFPTYMF